MLGILVIVNVNVINHVMLVLSAIFECIWFYTVFIVLSIIVLTMCTGLRAYFTYKYIGRHKENVSIYDYVYQAKNY